MRNYIPYLTVLVPRPTLFISVSRVVPYQPWRRVYIYIKGQRERTIMQGERKKEKGSWAKGIERFGIFLFPVLYIFQNNEEVSAKIQDT